MKFKDHLFILFILFALFGAIVTIQIRSTVSLQRQSAETLDMDRLKNQLDENIKAANYYESEIKKLENEKEAFLKAYNGSGSNLEAQNELQRLRLISGLTDVKGNGVIITLNDAETSDSDDVMDYIIHDSDILNVVNALKIAGAQAISINGERIIATSEQLCAGPTIKINNNRYAVPYEIKAIGDADALYAAMKDSSIINEMIEYKKRVTIKQQNDIVIPKFKNDINSLISRLEVLETQKNLKNR